MESNDKNTMRSDDSNHTEDITGGSSINSTDGDEGDSRGTEAVVVETRSVNDSLDRESVCNRNERQNDGRNNNDLGVYPIQQSHRSVHGKSNNYAQNDYYFENGLNGNEFRHLPPFQPFFNPFLYGGPSNFGGFGFGNQAKEFQPYYNPTYYGGPSNLMHRNIQFQPYYNPFIHGGPSNCGRNDHDFQPNRSATRQLNSYDTPVFGPRNNQRTDEYGCENMDFGVPSNRIENRQRQLSDNLENDEGTTESSRGSGNEKQDAHTKIEHQKLKRKITDLYKLKAPLNFSKSEVNFDKDNWVKVWYIGTEGFKLYQGQINCPVCFKKVTPQNRAGAGNLPRWELTPVKGHIERLHREGSTVQKGKDIGNENNLGNVEDETVSGEEDLNGDGYATESLATTTPTSNLVSSPEAKSLSPESDLSSPDSKSSSTESESSDSESTEPERRTALRQKDKLKRKTATKKTERDAGIKRQRRECPDWKKPGVEFAWVKFTSSSRFLPAFVFPLEKGKRKKEARQILTKGELEEKKHEVGTIATPLQVEQTKKLVKTKPYLAGLKQFNLEHNTNFQ